MRGREELCDEGETKFEGGAGAAGGEDAAVDDDFFGAEEMGKFLGDGEMGGVAAAGEQAGIVEDGGGGADGGEPAAGGMLPQYQFADTRVGAEVFYPGTAGEEHAVEVAGEDGRKRGVGVKRDGVAAGDMDALGQGGGEDLGPGAPEQVDGRHRLYFLKTFRQDCENRGHSVS